MEFSEFKSVVLDDPDLSVTIRRLFRQSNSYDDLCSKTITELDCEQWGIDLVEAGEADDFEGLHLVLEEIKGELPDRLDRRLLDACSKLDLRHNPLCSTPTCYGGDHEVHQAEWTRREEKK